MTNKEFDEMLREKITKGEITPEDAQVEYDFFANGSDSFQNIFGW